MPALVNFGNTAILTTARTVLLGLLPPDVEVIRAQVNRVPEPVSPDFCVLTPIRRDRLATNRDVDLDVKVIGGILNTTLTVTSGETLAVGYQLYGPSAAQGTVITAIGAKPNTYTVTPPQRVPAGTKLYAGRHAMWISTDAVIQCDVHGPNSDTNAQVIFATWRDDLGCYLFTAAAAPAEIQPLYADDPKQVPFINAEDQWEDRWVVDLHMQANIAVSLGQDFADSVVIDLIAADHLTPTVAPHVAHPLSYRGARK